MLPVTRSSPPPSSTASDPEAFVFGPFRLMVRRRELIAHGVPVTLGQRALDILLVLVRRHGQLVTKNELMDEVWPGVVVEENNLQVHISALRKALGDDKGERRYLLTVAGRGYRFVHPVEPEAGVSEAAPAAAASAAELAHDRPLRGRQHNIPRPLTSLIGRDAEIESVRASLGRQRLVTLVGAGGVGKTRLALALGADCGLSYPDGVWIIEFAKIANPDALVAVIADRLGLSSGGREPTIELLAAHLESKQALLILDNCEHLIADVAAIGEALLSRCPSLSILATSREPLGVAGECVLRVPSLSTPRQDQELSAETALGHASVRLFVERAAAVVPDFALNDANAPTIGAICRRLDGIPMAIELAAPRLKVLPPEQLLLGLDQRFRLLAGGSRSTVPRHQTLHALIDWSYELLNDDERALLRRLAVFSNGASLSSAAAVAAPEDAREHELLGLLASLVDKSLVVADTGGSEARYRLLETTRDYALEKLAEAGELSWHGRHARHFVARLAQATEAWETSATDAWLSRYAADVDNLRAALGWAFGPDGDVVTGLELVGFSHAIAAELGLALEHRRWVEDALARAETTIPKETLARLLSWHAGDVKDPDDPAEHQEALRAAALYQELGNRFQQGQLLLRAGTARLAWEENLDGERLLDEAFTLLEPFGPTKTLARCLSALASARLFASDVAAAQALHQKAIKIHRDIGRGRPSRST
jgi:predicted ATPase/DNA-binding winged helix-turn-helix (wHTH) protein